MFVKGVRSLQQANECECRDILTAVGNFGHLALEVTDVGLEAITLPHFDAQEVVVVPFDFSTRGILIEERFDDLLEGVERM